MYRIDNWINEGSTWTTEYVDGEYINTSIYNPLWGSTYIELPNELKKSKKRLISIKSNDNKCFPYCHIRNLNPLNKNPERITKVDEKIVNDLNYKDIKFPVSKKDYKMIKKKYLHQCIIMKIV